MTPLIPDMAETIVRLHPFSTLSPSAQSRLQDSAEPCRFVEGQVLSDAATIGDRILVLVEGEARLLGKRDKVPFTLERLNAGQIFLDVLAEVVERLYGNPTAAAFPSRG